MPSRAYLFGSEQGTFADGDELLIVDLEGVKFGLMICFDVEFTRSC
jgi:predicted amidohydrolase